MQETTSLPEPPAVAATSATSTNTWLSGANHLFRLPGNAPFPQQPQTPNPCPSPWEIVLPAALQELPPLRRAPAPGVRFPQCPPAKPTPCLLPSFRKSADSFSVTLASKKRIALRRNILSRRISARCSRKPCIFRKTLRSYRPFAVPLPPACVSRRAAPPHNRVRRGSAPLSYSRSLAEKKASSADAAVPLSPRSVRRGQSASPGKRGPLIFPCRNSRKKRRPAQKRRPSECSAAETANPCRKPTCWASACSDKFHALRTCSPDTCPWSCRARYGRRGSDAPADRRWKDQRTDLRFHPA